MLIGGMPGADSAVDAGDGWLNAACFRALCRATSWFTASICACVGRAIVFSILRVCQLASVALPLLDGFSQEGSRLATWRWPLCAAVHALSLVAVLYLIGCGRDERSLVTTPAATPMPTSGSNAKHRPKCAADQPYKQSAPEPLKPVVRSSPSLSSSARCQAFPVYRVFLAQKFQSGNLYTFAGAEGAGHRGRQRTLCLTGERSRAVLDALTMHAIVGASRESTLPNHLALNCWGPVAGLFRYSFSVVSALLPLA
jgi:hypothetical protein